MIEKQIEKKVNYGGEKESLTHYTEYLQKNPEWELAGIFADDGISAPTQKSVTTSTERSTSA